MNLRKYLFEFEDLPWFPAVIREGMTDYLRYMLSLTNFYQPITPVLLQAMANVNTQDIIDLCSGGGGPIEVIKKNIEKEGGKKVKFILTDKFPNSSAYKLLSEKTDGEISFVEASVDAADVPDELKGFRTIFSGFHHFDDAQAITILKNAVDNKAGIGIFDGGNKNIFTALFISLVHPFAFFLLTPFFQPFKFSRILFTYILPLIPLFTIWDGIVSITRLRSPEELLQLTHPLGENEYEWQAGKRKNKLGMQVAFLVGYPRQPAD